MKDRKTVLILENEPWINQLLEMFLEGYVTIFAESASQAAEFLKTAKPDAILIDIHLSNDENGEVFAKQLRDKLKKKTPRLIASTGGVIENEDLFDAIVRKPYSREDLVTAIEGREEAIWGKVG